MSVEGVDGSSRAVIEAGTYACVLVSDCPEIAIVFEPVEGVVVCWSRLWVDGSSRAVIGDGSPSTDVGCVARCSGVVDGGCTGGTPNVAAEDVGGSGRVGGLEGSPWTGLDGASELTYTEADG